jgi:predicted kinase
MCLLASSRAKLDRRIGDGYVRECHGDLHLANVVRLHGNLCAFDCLEFDQKLRNIDVWLDIAFMFMDLSFKARNDLAYIFVDGYLDVTGDYDGGSLLSLFANYRAMVRAKISAIQCEQFSVDSAQYSHKRLTALDYMNWAALNAKKSATYVVITHGYSGSGKSFWSKQLVSDLGCIRIRSDVLRKTAHGLGVLDKSHSEIAQGLYSKGKNEQLYRAIAQQVRSLLGSGENVLVDAACLQQWQQAILCDVASDLDMQILCVDFTAPEQVLKKRVAVRASQSGEVSEADETVLDWQLSQHEPLLSRLSVINFDTVEADYSALLQQIKDSLGIFD